MEQEKGQTKVQRMDQWQKIDKKRRKNYQNTHEIGGNVEVNVKVEVMESNS